MGILSYLYIYHVYKYICMYILFHHVKTVKYTFKLKNEIRNLKNTKIRAKKMQIFNFEAALALFIYTSTFFFSFRWNALIKQHCNFLYKSKKLRNLAETFYYHIIIYLFSYLHYILDTEQNTTAYPQQKKIYDSKSKIKVIFFTIFGYYGAVHHAFVPPGQTVFGSLRVQVL